MEYTKDELVIMKAKIMHLLEMERRHNIMASFSGFATLLGVSGTAVSLCKYLDKTMTGEDSLMVGTCCIVAAAMTGIFYNYVRKEGVKIEDKILEEMSNDPDYIVEEAYESVSRRR